MDKGALAFLHSGRESRRTRWGAKLFSGLRRAEPHKAYMLRNRRPNIRNKKGASIMPYCECCGSAFSPTSPEYALGVQRADRARKRLDKLHAKINALSVKVVPESVAAEALKLKERGFYHSKLELFKEDGDSIVYASIDEYGWVDYRREKKPTKKDAVAAVLGWLKRKPKPLRAHCRIIRFAVRDLGITSKCGTHSMRKTFAARIYQNLLDKGNADALRILQAGLGHENINNTIKYLSFNEAPLVEAMGEVFG